MNLALSPAICLFILCLLGDEANMENLIKMLEAIGCYEGVEICREEGIHTCTRHSIYI